jgi:hypothetical protein
MLLFNIAEPLVINGFNKRLEFRLQSSKFLWNSQTSGFGINKLSRTNKLSGFRGNMNFGRDKLEDPFSNNGMPTG